MIVLDTDHVTVLRYTEHERCALLQRRLQASADQNLAVSIISIEEQVRGWMAEIARSRDVHEQIVPYDRLADLWDFLKNGKSSGSIVGPLIVSRP